MKKYSWIVALLLALTFATLFISCGADQLEVPESKQEFENYPLDAGFNTWGGGPAGSPTQQGWGTDGFTWTDGKTMTVKNLGYELEAFQKARNLVLEFEEEGTITGGLHIIWGGYSSDDADNDALGGWNSTQVVGNNGEPSAPYATLKGTTLTVDITTLTKYAMWISPTAEALRFVIAYYTPDVKSLKIKEAYLQIPTDDAFVPVEKIELPASFVGYQRAEVVLASTLTPTTASNQTIIWSIMGWLDAANTAAADTAWATGKWVKPNNAANVSALKAIVDFKDIPSSNITGIVDDTVYPWVTGTVGTIPASKSKNIIIAQDLGTVKLRATVIDGALDAEDNVIDYVKEFDIPIRALNPVSLKFGASGAGNLAVKSNSTELKITYEAGNTGYTIDPSTITGSNAGSVNYEGVYAYFKVTLASGKTLADYPAIKVTIENTGGADGTWKNLMVAASNEEFDQGWLSNYALIYPQDNNGYQSGSMIKTLFFDASAIDSTCNGNEVYISIHVRGTTGVYKFTDISLMAGF